MKNSMRLLVATLTLSAAGFIGIVSDESYTSAAIIRCASCTATSAGPVSTPPS